MKTFNIHPIKVVIGEAIASKISLFIKLNKKPTPPIRATTNPATFNQMLLLSILPTDGLTLPTASPERETTKKRTIKNLSPRLEVWKASNIAPAASTNIPILKLLERDSRGKSVPEDRPPLNHEKTAKINASTKTTPTSPPEYSHSPIPLAQLSEKAVSLGMLTYPTAR